MSEKKSGQEPSWGPAPNAGQLTALLKERYPSSSLSFRVSHKPRAVELTSIVHPHTHGLRVEYLRGAKQDPWMLMVDAIDNLYGSLVESRFEHRHLPQGIDVEFQGAFFKVTIERSAPDLEKMADALLEKGG